MRMAIFKVNTTDSIVQSLVYSTNTHNMRYSEAASERHKLKVNKY